MRFGNLTVIDNKRKGKVLCLGDLEITQSIQNVGKKEVKDGCEK